MPEGLLEVGHIAKAHGLRGEVVVTLSTDVTSRVDPGSTLYTDSGPLEVVASRPHQHRWIVQFAGVEQQTDDEAFAHGDASLGLEIHVGALHIGLKLDSGSSGGSGPQLPSSEQPALLGHSVCPALQELLEGMGGSGGVARFMLQAPHLEQ